MGGKETNSHPGKEPAEGGGGERSWAPGSPASSDCTWLGLEHTALQHLPSQGEPDALGGLRTEASWGAQGWFKGGVGVGARGGK